MMDNASNNDTFMYHLESAQLDAGYRFNAGEHRLWYPSRSHWSNVTRDALQEELSKWRRLGPLGKTHTMALYSRKKPINLLETLLRPEVRHTIEIYVDENPLLEEDSETLKDNPDNSILSSMMLMGWEQLDKYYSAIDQALEPLAAVVMNLKLKWRYFEIKWDRQHVLANLEQGSQSDLPHDEDDNRFWAWMDLGTPGLQVKDDYERYCLNSEPESSIENPIQYVPPLSI
ncbi:hypothetical protein HOY82DRAFT_534601 [Tuber indicum]|nr:hypothetical protein HOY82DRAFT_534601 [Tuber indicum]